MIRLALVFAVLIFVVWVSLAAAAPAERAYFGTVTRVRDADTVEVFVPAWRETPFASIALRAAGVDTPETRGRCPAETALAARANARVRQLMPVGSRVRFVFVDHDKYAGRIVARVDLPGAPGDWSQVLLQEGLAKPYKGVGSKPRWCPVAAAR